MLIAYIDEVGEAGPFVSKNHPKCNTSPVFGYAGFIVPEEHVHALSRDVALTKQRFYSLLCGDKQEEREQYTPTWERKGAELLSKHAMGRAGRREVIALRALLSRISGTYGGKLFYFVREKPKNKREERTLKCLSEAINRLCTYAESEEQNILLFQDMINENERYHQV